MVLSLAPSVRISYIVGLLLHCTPARCTRPCCSQRPRAPPPPQPRSAYKRKKATQRPRFRTHGPAHPLSATAWREARFSSVAAAAVRRGRVESTAQARETRQRDADCRNGRNPARSSRKAGTCRFLFRFSPRNIMLMSESQQARISPAMSLLVAYIACSIARMKCRQWCERAVAI
jgi:hypothetical protein